MARDKLVKQATRFYNAAMRLSKFIENETISGENLEELFGLVKNVSALWEKLPEVEPDLPEFHRDHNRHIRDAEFVYPREELDRRYHSMPNPLSPLSLVHDLLESLNRLHTDLHKGICEYEAGMIRDAIWEWTYPDREYFEGDLKEALRVLYIFN